MTDSGAKAGTPPKAIRQSKRAHALAIVGLVLIALSGPLAKAGVFSPMIGMLGFTIASLLLFIALILIVLAVPVWAVLGVVSISMLYFSDVLPLSFLVDIL